MAKLLRIKNISNPSSETMLEINLCNTFFSKFAGLMFQKELRRNSGILLINQKESRIDTAIHMLFMNFDIAVFWIDKNNMVIDKTIAKRWVPAYIPKTKAKMVLETHISQNDFFNIGDLIGFEFAN